MSNSCADEKSSYATNEMFRELEERTNVGLLVPKENERIIEFYFTAYGELGEKIPLILAVELALVKMLSKTLSMPLLNVRF